MQPQLLILVIFYSFIRETYRQPCVLASNRTLARRGTSGYASICFPRGVNLIQKHRHTLAIDSHAHTFKQEGNYLFRHTHRQTTFTHQEPAARLFSLRCLIILSADMFPASPCFIFLICFSLSLVLRAAQPFGILTVWFAHNFSAARLLLMWFVERVHFNYYSTFVSSLFLLL